MIDGIQLSQVYKANPGFALLDASEVDSAIDEVKSRHAGRPLQFMEVAFKEPTKEEMASHISNSNEYYAVPRKAEVTTFCLESNSTIVDIVSLDKLSPDHRTSTFRQDVQPPVSPSEYELCEKMCKEYPPLLDVLKARGLDPQWLVVDAWCVGPETPAASERIVWPSMFYFDQNPAADGKGTVDNICYARPIEGIEIRISLTRKEVIRFDDLGLYTLPVPGSLDATTSRYVPPAQQRTDLKPIVITQPQGPSFAVDGNRVTWQNFSLQVGFNGREGCTLHFVEFHNRPVVHRLSMCEMVVPYGDPRSPHHLKNAFDAGEDGLGKNANSLVLGCDCLGLIHYFDAHLVADRGERSTIVNAICMHEEDCGLGWKHTDWRTGTPYLARNRRLVISFVTTIANYEYGFYYHLYLDGTIEVEIKLTGVVSTGTLSAVDQANGGRKYGVRLGGSLYAPVHQHFFVSRIDFAIDGASNYFSELNCQAEEESEELNPHGNAFYYTDTVMETEKAAIRDCSSLQGRFWKISSSHRTNKVGGHTAYKLVPSHETLPFANVHKARYLKRAGFLAHQLWVTQFQPDERYPGGEYPNQLMTVDGLPKWTQQDRTIKDQDIVVWHVVGVTHLPRLEDWPVMPVEHCSFKLKPSGFMNSSPVMDVPNTTHNFNKSSSSNSAAQSHCCGESN